MALEVFVCRRVHNRAPNNYVTVHTRSVVCTSLPDARQHSAFTTVICVTFVMFCTTVTCRSRVILVSSAHPTQSPTYHMSVAGTGLMVV